MRPPVPRFDHLTPGPTAWPVPLSRRRAGLRAQLAPQRFLGAAVGSVAAVLGGTLGLLGLLAWSQSAEAQTAASADPTRPFTTAAPATPARTTASGNPTARPAPAPVLRVQAIALPQQGRPSALVNGRLVHLGERLGNAVVTSIDAQGLTLRHAKGQTQRLSLYADAEQALSAAPLLDLEPAPAGAAKDPS